MTSETMRMVASKVIVAVDFEQNLTLTHEELRSLRALIRRRR